jgi:hypothetical protein
LKEEIEEHLALQTAENLRAGLSPGEAHRQAMMKFGPVEAIKEDYRAERGLPFIDTLLQDIRFALRMLRKSPGFTTAAVLTLALGIGANTAIFSLVDWLTLRPLPIDRPSRVVFLEKSYNNGDTGTQFSYPDFQRFQQQTSGIFADISATQMFQMDGLSVDGKSQPMWSNYVDGDFFSLLGIKPALGRFILHSEGKATGADPVLVLGYSYWKLRLSCDPNIIGKKVSVNGHPMTIVGVAPQHFQGLAALLDTQGYMPLGMAEVLQDAPKNFLADTKTTTLAVLARLKQGVSLKQTQPVLQIVAQRLSEQNHSEMIIHAVPLGTASLVTGPQVGPALNLVSS